MKRTTIYCCGAALMAAALVTLLFVFGGPVISQAFGLDFREIPECEIPDIALTDEPYELDLTEPPAIQISYAEGDLAACVTIPWGQGSWGMNGDDWEGGEMKTFVACGSPVVEWSDPITISRVDNTDAVKLQFLLEPDSYTVTRWPEKVVGDYYAYGDAFCIMEITDDVIPLESDGIGYVYQIDVEYPYGSIMYGFAVPAL